MNEQGPTRLSETEILRDAEPHEEVINQFVPIEPQFFIQTNDLRKFTYDFLPINRILRKSRLVS